METMALTQAKAVRKSRSHFETPDFHRLEHLRAARLDLTEEPAGGLHFMSEHEAARFKQELRHFCEVFDEEGQAFVLNIGEYLNGAKSLHRQLPSLLRYAVKAKEMDYDILIVRC